MLTQGSAGPGTTFSNRFCVITWQVGMCTLHLLMCCALSIGGRLCDSPAARGQCTKMLSSSLKENQIQLCLDHCTAPHASALAPVPRMALPWFAQQVDCYFLNCAWHLTQIWNICGASCNLPMAKAKRLFLALQWASPTTCCPYFVIRCRLLECMSALSGVQIALMDQALRGLSCATGIVSLSQWNVTLGLDGLGVWLIGQRNLSHGEDTPSGTPEDTDSDFSSFFSSSIPERLYVLHHASNSWEGVVILAPEHLLCSKSKAWTTYFLIRWPLLNTFQFVS